MTTTMHIFLAGATGAVGRVADPPAHRARPHRHRHDAQPGEGRRAARARRRRRSSSTALDRDAVIAAVAAARPDAIVHQMTALGGLADLRHFERAFAATNRLRTEGTDNLLAAARAAGVRARRRAELRRLALRARRRAGQDRGRPARPGPARAAAHDARGDPPRRSATVTAAGGVVLRYGGFYGPGTGPRAGRRAVGDGPRAQVPGRRRRRRRVVVHPHRRRRGARRSPPSSAGRPARSTTSSTTSPRPCASGCRPSPSTIGARPPRHVPRFVGRLMGEHVVAMMCEIRGASNAKAPRASWAGARPGRPGARASPRLSGS